MRFLSHLRHAYKATHLTYPRKNALSYASVAVNWERFHTRYYGSKAPGKRNDEEAFQDALAVLSLLKDNGPQVQLFADVCTKLKLDDRGGGGGGGGGGGTTVARATRLSPEKTFNRGNPQIWTAFKREHNPPVWVHEKKPVIKERKERKPPPPIEEVKENPVPTPSVSLTTKTEGKERSEDSFGLPEKIADELKKIPVSGMQLNLEMDMTNVKDALLNPSKLTKFRLRQKKQADSRVALSTKVRVDSNDTATIPLHFHAMIHGTVEVNPKELSDAKLKNLQVPEFNEYVTAIAANLCSTALQKGFPTDVNRRLYSNKESDGEGEEKVEKLLNKYEKPKKKQKPEPLSSEPAEDDDAVVKLFERYDESKSNRFSARRAASEHSKTLSMTTITVSEKASAKASRSRSPNVVCVREGEKGCTSPGLAGNKPFVPKQGGETASLSTATKGGRSTFGLLDCKVYKQSLQEAEKRRKELSKASSSKCGCSSKESGSKCKKSGAKKSSSSTKCGAKKSSSSTKCGAKKSGSSTKCGAKKSGSSTKCGAKKSGSSTKCGAKKSASSTKCGAKKSSSSTKCGAKKSASSSSCGCSKSSSKSGGSKCGKKSSSSSKCGAKKSSSSSKCGAKKSRSSSKCGAKKSASSSKCGAKKSSSSTKCGAKKSASSSSCGCSKSSSKSGGSKCGKKSSSSSKCGAKKSSSSSKCGAKKSRSSSKCGAKKSPSSSKCGAKKSASSSKCGAKKSPSSSKCGAKKSASSSKCGAKKSSSSSKCGAKKSKSSSSCGSKGGGSKCAKKSSSTSKCGQEAARSSRPKCGSKSGGKSKSSCKKSKSSSSCGSKSSKASKCGSKTKSKCGAKVKPRGASPDSKSACKRAAKSKCGSKGRSSSDSKVNKSKGKSKSKCGRPARGDTRPKCKKSSSKTSKCSKKSSSSKSKNPCKKSSSTSSTVVRSASAPACGSESPCRTQSRTKATKTEPLSKYAAYTQNLYKTASSASSIGSSKSRSSSVSSIASNPSQPQVSPKGDKASDSWSTRRGIHTLATLPTPFTVKLNTSSCYILVRDFSSKCKKGPKGPYMSKRSDEYRRETCDKFSWRDTIKHRKKRKEKPKNCYPEDMGEFCPSSSCYRIMQKSRKKKPKENEIVNEKALCTVKLLAVHNRPLLLPANLCNHHQVCHSSSSTTNQEGVIKAPYQVCTGCPARPKPKNKEVLVRVEAVSLSDSDIHMFETGGKKYSEITLGNEAAGIVEQVTKDVTHLKPGDHVVVETGLPCGKCNLCLTGHYNICNHMSFKGCLRKYCTHPASFCHKIDSQVPLEHAALVYQMALGCNACEKARIKPNSKVAIIGSCTTTLCAAMCAQAMGAQNICVLSSMEYTEDVVREFVTDKVVCIESTEKETKTVETMKCLLGGQPDIVINCASCTKTMNTAIMALKPSGVCVIAGFISECASFNLMDALMKEIHLVQSFRSKNMFPMAINILECGKAPIDCILADCCRWDLMQHAFKHALSEANIGPRRIVIQCQIGDASGQKKKK